MDNGRRKASWALGPMAALALGAMFAAPPARADGPISNTRRDEASLRCEGNIVSKGDAKQAVEEKCGKPTSTDNGGEVWVYDFGSGGFVYYLTFLDGKLIRIQRGEYGGPQ